MRRRKLDIAKEVVGQPFSKEEELTNDYMLRRTAVDFAIPLSVLTER